MASAPANENSHSFTGRCFCDAITYTLNGELIRSYICHCIDCRQSTGSSFALNAVFPREALSINDPSSLLATFGDASKGEGTKRFCGRCGSGLFLTVPDTIESMRDQVIVLVGTIDGSEVSEALKPVAEGWCKRREAWMGRAQGAEEFDEW